MHAESAAWHTQSLNLYLDSAGQLFGRGLAHAAEFAGFFFVVPSVGRQFFTEALDCFVVGVQPF